jgi:uncharacterized protein RhaS with RHS repeats
MWLSRDPIAENGGINLYAYVGNDPVNYWDPLGLWTFRLGAAYGIGGFVEFGTDNGGFSVGGGLGFGLGAILDYTPTPESVGKCSSDPCDDYEQVGDSISVGFEISGAARLGPLAGAGGSLGADLSAGESNNFAITGNASGSLGVGYGEAGAAFGGSVSGGIRGNGLNSAEAFGNASVGNSYGFGAMGFSGFTSGYTFR